MRASLALALLLVAALVATGCGGPSNSSVVVAEACERQIKEVEEELAAENGTPTARSSTERLEEENLVECAGQKPEEPVAAAETEADGDAAAGAEGGAPTTAVLDRGRELFTEKCGVCHQLADAGTNGQVGPNLDEETYTVDFVETQIENGASGMPAGLLEGQDATDVASYVAASAGE